MFASLFTHVDQVPTLLKIHSRRNFYSYMFAVLHSAHCYREVMQPVGSNINQVYVIAFTKFFVSFLSGINSCLRQRCFLQILLAALSTWLFIITKSHDLRTGNMGKTLYSTGATHTQSYESYSNDFHLRGSQPNHTLLPSRTLGSFHNNSSILPFPLSALVIGLHSRSLRCACT